MNRCKISFVWSAVPVIRCFQKDEMSIFLSSSTCILDCSRRFSWILTYRRQFLDVIQSEFAVRNFSCLDVIWEKRSSRGVNFSGLPDLRRSPANFLLYEMIVYSVSNCFMSIKMNSNIINVETSFRHAHHAAVFISGRLLWFNIPKFHQIPITCWCVLSSDLVYTS